MSVLIREFTIGVKGMLKRGDVIINVILRLFWIIAFDCNDVKNEAVHFRVCVNTKIWTSCNISAIFLAPNLIPFIRVVARVGTHFAYRKTARHTERAQFSTGNASALLEDHSSPRLKVKSKVNSPRRSQGSD